MISTQLAGYVTSWLLLLVRLSKAKGLVPIGERAMALRGAIRSLTPALETPFLQGLELERSLSRDLDDTHDHSEGYDARPEGREPEFRGA